MKKILFTLLFTAGKMQFNFVSGVVGVKQPTKKRKQTRERDIETSMLEATIQAFIEEVLR